MKCPFCGKETNTLYGQGLPGLKDYIPQCCARCHIQRKGKLIEDIVKELEEERWTQKN